MSVSEPVPADLQRFILRSIDSVPHLEALLLLRRNVNAAWDAQMMAQRLYIPERRAAELLEDLTQSGFVAAIGQGGPPAYRYQPSTHELGGLMDRLASAYASSLIEVTRLIHSKTSRQAQSLGDAFKWPREKT